MKQIISVFFLLVLFNVHTPLLAEYPLPETLVDEEIHDPLETINRGSFWFNDKVDVYLLEPIARGYDEFPEVIKTGINNFFDNYNSPSYLLNDALQWKWDQFGTHLGRFTLNTTVGLGGFIDVAETIDLDRHYEDFGTTLGYYGVNAGPYLMIPLLGPSTTRELTSYIVDGAITPLAFMSYGDVLTDTEVFVAGAALYTIQAIDTRAGLLEAVESGKESSLDYYLFVQSTYYQYRRNLIYDGKVPKFSEDEWDDTWEDDIDWDDEALDPPASE